MGMVDTHALLKLFFPPFGHWWQHQYPQPTQFFFLFLPSHVLASPSIPHVLPKAISLFPLMGIGGITNTHCLTKSHFSFPPPRCWQHRQYPRSFQNPFYFPLPGIGGTTNTPSPIKTLPWVLAARGMLPCEQ